MKTLTMYQPNAIQNVLNDFDHCFESFFGDSLLTPTRFFNHLPEVDIQETENSYIMDMELPGYNEKNIEVHLEGANITISAKQKEQEEKKSGEGETDGTYILRERRTGSFSRSFKLPENANPEAVSAVFKNGVLNLQIKKRAEAQKKTIQINAA
jgi:HSP20 family protein